jgi:outer membrane protein assembly factor BamB
MRPVVGALLALLGFLSAAGMPPSGDTEAVMYRGDAKHSGVYPASKIPEGRVKWSFQAGNKIRSTPALYQGAVYFGSDDGHLYSLDNQSGKLRWKFQAAGAVSSSPAIYRDTVYFEAATRCSTQWIAPTAG